VIPYGKRHPVALRWGVFKSSTLRNLLFLTLSRVFYSKDVPCDAQVQCHSTDSEVNMVRMNNCISLRRWVALCLVEMFLMDFLQNYSLSCYSL